MLAADFVESDIVVYKAKDALFEIIPGILRKALGRCGKRKMNHCPEGFHFGTLILSSLTRQRFDRNQMMIDIQDSLDCQRSSIMAFES